MIAKYMNNIIVVAKLFYPDDISSNKDINEKKNAYFSSERENYLSRLFKS